MTFALAIPHTPWVPARVESCKRVRPLMDGEGVISSRVFSDRAPNWQWSLEMWRWFVAQDAEWCVQLQDDVVPHPRFWQCLAAMLEGAPDARFVGLHAGHPSGPALAARGTRWYRTRAWVVGVGWVMHRDLVRELVAWREAHEEHARRTNEDDLIGQFLAQRGDYAWHPMPSIIDHDVTVPSTYANDTHPNRRPSVLWDEYDAAAMQTAAFWRAEQAPVLASPYANLCALCGAGQAVAMAHTGLGTCRVCLVRMVGAAMGLQLEEQ